MKIQRLVGTRRPIPVIELGRFLSVAIAGCLWATALSLAAQEKEKPAQGKDENSVGFIASKQASAKEVGLPLYPGARPHKDNADDSPGVQLGMWGGSSGFKLVVMKLQSSDAPEKVEIFYRKALAKYGRVLNCSDPSQETKDKNKSSGELDCEADQPEKGELVLKAGTKQMQHIVAIKHIGEQTIFQLVYVAARGSDSN